MQKIFFLSLGLFGLILTGNLLFSLQSNSYIQGSSSSLENYLLSATNVDREVQQFSKNYAPKTLVRLKSNDALSKKTLSISCSNQENPKYIAYSEKERGQIFVETLLPNIMHTNNQILKQRFYLLNILKNNFYKLTLSDYKKYMLTRKVKNFKNSRLFFSSISSLESLKDSPLLIKKNSKFSLNPDFSIFSSKIDKKENDYINKVNLKKYNLTQEEELYIKRLAYKNWLRRAAYINNPNLLLVALIASIDAVPPSIFLAQAKEESDMAQSRAAYTLNNLFGTQITPNKKFDSNIMGRVCGSKTVRLRKFKKLQDTLNFQLEVYNQNITTMSLMKNNRLLERLNLKAVKGQNIIDEMPGYAEKPGYKNRLIKAINPFTIYDPLLVMLEDQVLDFQTRLN